MIRCPITLVHLLFQAQQPPCLFIKGCAVLSQINNNSKASDSLLHVAGVPEDYLCSSLLFSTSVVPFGPRTSKSSANNTGFTLRVMQPRLDGQGHGQHIKTSSSEVICWLREWPKIDLVTAATRVNLWAVPLELSLVHWELCASHQHSRSCLRTRAGWSVRLGNLNFTDLTYFQAACCVLLFELNSPSE